MKQFGNVTVSRAVSGIGMAGLCVSQLSFDVPDVLYAPRAAKTVVTGISGVPTFYIDKRTKSDGVVSVVCLDRLAFADVAFPIDECIDPDIVKYSSKDVFPAKGSRSKLYYDSSTDKYYKWNGSKYVESSETAHNPTLPIAEVLQLIINTVGFDGLTGVPYWLTEIPRAKLQCTCSEILSYIAECCCGFFYMTDDDVCTFLPFGSYSSMMAVDKYTAPDIGIEYTPMGILCTDGSGNQFSLGSAVNCYDTIQIESDLITQEGCAEIWARADGETLTQFSCEKALVSSVPYPAVMMKFRQGDDSVDMIAHSISCRITASGIIANLIGNAPSDGEIGSRHRLTRNRVEYGKKCGNIMNTPYQGLVILDDEEV